jgi:hypothetical protein
VLAPATGHDGDSNRPPLAEHATRQPPTPAANESSNRPRAAAHNRPSAATASATGPPGAGPGAPTSTPVAIAARVKNTRTASARPANRRSHPRTVVAGTPNPAAIDLCPPPPTAFALNAAPITSTEYALRSRHDTGSNTCVTRHAEQRLRRGRNRCEAPANSVITRQRANPHALNRAPHPGHASSPERS